MINKALDYRNIFHKVMQPVLLFLFISLATTERNAFPLTLWKFQIMMTTSEIAVVLFLMVVFVIHWGNWANSFRAHLEMLAFPISLFIIATISTILSLYPYEAARYSMHLFAGFSVFVTWSVFMTLDQTNLLAKVLVVWDLVICLLAFVERFWFGYAWELLSRVRNGNFNTFPRASSIFESPNVFGSYSTVIFAVVFTAFLLKRINVVWFLLEAIVEIASITLSGSRNAVFVMGLLLIVSWLIFPKSRRVIGWVTLIFVLAIWIYPLSRNRLIETTVSPATALSHRPQIWKAAINAWESNPWFGIGNGVFRKVNETYGGPGGEGVLHTHNIYFDFLVSMGLVGFSWLLAMIGFYALKIWRYVASGRSFVVALPFLTALLSQSFFDYFLDHNLPYGVVFWLAIAYSVKLVTTHENKGGEYLIT